jgi:hypothetical protein
MDDEAHGAAHDAETEHLVQILAEREKAVSVIEPCSLAEYRQYVGHLPRPSAEQIDNYVRFVSEAHSWYKHLPMLPPGEPFHFFVDPFSGYDRLVQRGGGVMHQERTETSKRFHYTWMMTRDYRARFGHLAYESGVGSQFFVQSGDTVREYADLPIFSTADRAYRIPREIWEAGSVELTAIVHPKAARLWDLVEDIARRRGEGPEGSSRQWPEETGGEATLRKIRQVLTTPGEGGWREAEEKLDALLLPERRRLQNNMTQAIHRMLALLYE